MRRLLWLALLLVVPSLATAQGLPAPPMLPPVTPPALPNCPVYLMGQSNGIFYYVTKACEVNGVSGFGQSTSDFTAKLPCCVGNGPCKPDCFVLPTIVGLTVNTSAAPVPCDLPGTTPTELDEKLQAIIARCEAYRDYLDRLADSRQDVPDWNPRGRVKKWRDYLQKDLIPFLKDARYTAEVRIEHFCKTVLPSEEKHQLYWSYSVLKHGSTGKKKTQFIQDVKQPKLLSDDEVIFEPGSGVTVGLPGYCRMTVSDVQGTNGNPETVELYFKTFIVNVPPGIVVPTGVTVPNGNSQIAIQIQKPSAKTILDTAELQDRNRFGHKIAVTSNPGTAAEVTRPYLCSTYLDLAIAK